MKNEIAFIIKNGNVFIDTDEICAYEIDHLRDILFIYIKCGKHFSIPNGEESLNTLITNLNEK